MVSQLLGNLRGLNTVQFNINAYVFSRIKSIYNLYFTLYIPNLGKRQLLPQSSLRTSLKNTSNYFFEHRHRNV